MTARAIASGLVAALALLAPALASACPMCLSGQGGGKIEAFAIGSIFLSVTPLAVIGLAVWYLRRRARQVQHEDEIAREQAAPLPLRTPSPH